MIDGDGQVRVIAQSDGTGLGIAVANAEDALKEKAEVVTISNNNEDAVSEAIERFLFN